MIFRVLNRLYFLFFLLIISNISINSQYREDQLKAMQWIKKTVQQDIKNIIKPILFRAFTRKERIIAQDIDVNVVLDTRFIRVRALPKPNYGVIEISTGFLSLIGTLIDANLVAAKFQFTDKLLTYNILISNYIKNYYEQVISGKDLSMPEPFHKFVGINDITYMNFSHSKDYDNVFSMNMRIILCYVLAHEYAHHIFGHLTTKVPNNLEESRRNEDEADDFSIRVNWMLFNNPLAVANYYVLFSLVEGNFHEGTHAPSACRLEKFLNAGIKFTESLADARGQQIPEELSRLLDQIRVAHDKLKTLCENGDAMTDTTIPGLW